MLKVLFVFMCVTVFYHQAFATTKAAEETKNTVRDSSSSQPVRQSEKSMPAEDEEIFTSSVTDVTAEYRENNDLEDAESRDTETREPRNRDLVTSSEKEKASHSTTSRAPKVPAKTGVGTALGKAIGSGLSQVTLSQLVTLGEKIWNYVIDNKPNAQFQTIKASIVPSGVTDWTELSGWTAPVAKVYHVQFKDAVGVNSGSFDYRITFVPGGSYQGHGKFLGEIEFTPMNIKLATGRSLNVTAELSSPLNFGTTGEPIAAAQLLVSWTTPTLTHYQMQSAEYFIYGSGDIQDLSGGTSK